MAYYGGVTGVFLGIKTEVESIYWIRIYTEAGDIGGIKLTSLKYLQHEDVIV